LPRVPDPRGRQGQDYLLGSILRLIVVSLLCGRRGIKAAFLVAARPTDQPGKKIKKSRTGGINLVATPLTTLDFQRAS
jgi:hypothetical protein